MFLSLLSSDQRHAFAEIARFIIHADAHLDAEEGWYFNLLQKEMGMETLAPRSTTSESYHESLKLFDNRFSKNILLLEAVTVALADGDIDESEMKVLEDIVERCRMKPEKIEIFRGYAERVLALVNDGQELIASR
jgi:tellurite resistance protein